MSQLPQNCLYLMSFSKLTAPVIRISTVIGPGEAIARLARVQAFTYRHLPVMEQVTLAHFIEHGYFMRHMRRARNMVAGFGDTLKEGPAFLYTLYTVGIDFTAILAILASLFCFSFRDFLGGETAQMVINHIRMVSWDRDCSN